MRPMKRILSTLKNIFTNARLIILLAAAFFCAYCAAFMPAINDFDYVFVTASAVFASVFSNFYTNMFGTTKTDTAIKSIISTLNDYYYIVERERRDLTPEEHKTVRELLKVASILSPNHKDFEIFKKHRKLEIEKKKMFLSTPSQTPTFNQNVITYTGLVLDNYGDAQNTASTGSAHDLVDPKP